MKKCLAKKINNYTVSMDTNSLSDNGNVQRRSKRLCKWYFKLNENGEIIRNHDKDDEKTF